MLSVDSSAVAWVIVAVIAAILEVSLPTFGAIFVSLGALVAALTAATGFGLTVQLVIFSLTLGLSLVVLRPRVMAKMSGRGVPSRTEVLIGREGVVTHDIDTRIGAGRVNVGGEDWAARADAPLAAGTRVRVLRADGIVLEVTKA